MNQDNSKDKKSNSEKPASELKKVVPSFHKDKKDFKKSSKRRVSRFTIFGSMFLIVGFVLLSLAYYYVSDILVIIGIALTLWGGLFFFIKSTRYVDANILSSSVISSVESMEKIVRNIDPNGKGIYLAPKRLKNVDQSILFISDNTSNQRIGLKLIDSSTFSVSGGICIPSLGEGLLSLYEKKLRTEFSSTSLEYFTNNLPQLLVEDLKLVQKMEISVQKEIVNVTLFGSVFKNLYNKLSDLTFCSRIGCPLSSSLAGAIAKVTNKDVVIANCKSLKRGKIIEIKYRILDD